MPITGTHEIDGRVFRFRKPHLGPIRRFTETLKLANEGASNASDLFSASFALIHDAVSRLEPSLTLADLENALDEDDLPKFVGAVMSLIGAKEEAPGEAPRPTA